MQRTFTLFVFVILALTLAQAPGGCPFTFLPPTNLNDPPSGDDTPDDDQLPDGALPQPIPPIDPLNQLPETVCPSSVVFKGPITVTGTIDDVTATTLDFGDAGQTVTNTRLHIELNLVSDASFNFFGTAHATWTSDAVHTVQPHSGTPCPVIETHYAYEPSEWNEDVLASLVCVDSHGQTWLRFKGDPRGSPTSPPVNYVQSNSCSGNAFNLTAEGESWYGFSETGIDPKVAGGQSGSLDVRYDLPHPVNTVAGGIYREVHLKFN